MEDHKALGESPTEWKTSKNSQGARYYQLTPEGRKQLSTQNARWNQFVGL